MNSRQIAIGVCAVVFLSMAGVAQATSLYITTTNTVDVGTNDLTIRQGDVGLYNMGSQTATLAFDRDNFRRRNGRTGASANVDAFDVMPDGSFLLSTTGDTYLGSNVLKIRPGDVVRYDAGTDTAEIMFDHDTFRRYSGRLGGSGDVDAVHLLPDGNFLMSTASTSRLGSPMLKFKDGDLVEYDPVNDVASLFLPESVFRRSNGNSADADIDGVSMLNSDTLLLSTRDNEYIGDPLLKYRDGDIVAYSISMDTAWIYFSEDDLHCSAQDIDGLAVLGVASPAPPVAVPEPLTICAAAMGLLGLGGYLRRRKAFA